MSPKNDRVAVPTNGHQPAMAATERGTATPAALDPPTPRATVPAVTPAQLAAGFGIVAAVILLLLGRRRNRHD